MAKDNPTRGTRLPDEMDADFEAYRDAKEMNNSEALRELVRAGLEAEQRESVGDLSPVYDVLTQLAGVLAAMTIGVGFGGVVGVLPLGTAVVWGVSMLAVALTLLSVVASGLVEPVDERLRERRTPDTLAEVSD